MTEDMGHENPVALKSREPVIVRLQPQPHAQRFRQTLGEDDDEAVAADLMPTGDTDEDED